MDWKWSSMLIAALAVITVAGCTAPSLESRTESAPAIPTAANLMPTPTPEPMTEATTATVEEAILLPTPTAEAQVKTSKRLTAEQEVILAGLRNQGAAPELTNDTWINSAPLALADLRGNVVIVEFWTYG